MDGEGGFEGGREGGLWSVEGKVSLIRETELHLLWHFCLVCIFTEQYFYVFTYRVII